MAIYKIFPSADATLYSSYPVKNTGRDEVVEVAVKNSNDALRFNSRALLDQSPYYNYDLAANDNYTVPSNIPATPDIRRGLLQFSNSDLTILQAFASQSISGSWKAALKMNLAFAQNLNTTYSLEAYAVTQSWTMGTGKYANVPESRNGTSWNTTGPSVGSAQWQQNPLYWGNNLLNNWEDNISWLYWEGATPALPSTFVTGGGSWNAAKSGSQYFDYMSNKDINMDVTLIMDAWFSGSVENKGIILKHPDTIEQLSGSFVDLKFFSVDTHTIYPPCIEFRWDDSHYFPVGSNYILNNQFTLTLSNNPGVFKQGSIYKFRTATRDTYPVRQFTTSSVYLQSKYLPQETYWAIQDVKTNEMLVDFDEQYTRVSADNISNYFNIYMNGLEPERFYRIIVKTKIYSTTLGPLSVYDNQQSIYNALALYGPENLALLPTEEFVVDNNLIFKVVR